ncbi:hypothetical protein TrRE_jg6061 [Triparma retinervis]|uniref:Uncharacterized protein n=1 Tax=Triparma retinervis TaxID=2557542 RepID=A0A9W7CKG3_9STRA|nr:hypothetical protein TrRE_jg6061 [Triparma retinervis]
MAASALILSAATPNPGFFSINVLVYSRDVLTSLRILNASVGKQVEHVTGLVNVGDPKPLMTGQVEMRMSLEGSMLMLRSVHDELEKHEEVQTFEIQGSRDYSSSSFVEGRFFSSFSLNLPSWTVDGNMGSENHPAAHPFFLSRFPALSTAAAGEGTETNDAEVISAISQLASEIRAEIVLMEQWQGRQQQAYSSTSGPNSADR